MAQRGQKPKYRPEYAGQVAKLMMYGAKIKEISAFFNVSERTVDNWRENYPEFAQAMQRARTEMGANVTVALYRRAIGYKHPAVKIFMPAGAAEPVYAKYTEHYPPDTQAAVTILKNLNPEKWRDRHEIEATIKDVDRLTDAERQALILCIELTADGAGGFADQAPREGEAAREPAPVLDVLPGPRSS